MYNLSVKLRIFLIKREHVPQRRCFVCAAFFVSQTVKQVKIFVLSDDHQDFENNTRV